MADPTDPFVVARRAEIDAADAAIVAALNRRIDAGYLAQLVAEHRLGEEEAVQTAVDLAYRLPKLAYARRDGGA